MSDVLNRNTKELRQSVNTPDFVGSSDWLINPDLSAVKGIDSRYWTISGDKVLPMDAAEQAAIEAAIEQTAKALEVSSAKAALETDKRFAVLFAEVNELRKHLGLKEKTIDEAVEVKLG